MLPFPSCLVNNGKWDCGIIYVTLSFRYLDLNTLNPPVKSRITLRETFSALQYRNYRLWFYGQLVSLIGTWMQTTAQQYLIYDLSNSTALLGLVTFISGVPSILFSAFGGVIADRISRRTLMLITQTVMLLLAFILAVLVFTHTVQIWHIIVLAALLGIANAFDAPARQSFPSDLVEDQRDLTNAIALNATMFNMAVVFGPAVSGMVYFLFGPAWCFTINGFSFIAVIIALLLMKIKITERKTVRVNMFKEIGDGIRFITSKPDILWLILFVGVVSFLGFGFISQSPAWAKGVLLGDERINGWMLTMRGIGSLFGALLVAALGRRRVQGRLWATGSIILPVCMILFAFIPWLPLKNSMMILTTMVMLVLIGVGLMLVTNTTNAMVQTRTPEHLRGRVMGLYVVVFQGGMPIGSLLVGGLAAVIGLPQAILIGAVLMAIFVIGIWLFRGEVRKLE
jgi:MFS family permease